MNLKEMITNPGSRDLYSSFVNRPLDSNIRKVITWIVVLCQVGVPLSVIEQVFQLMKLCHRTVSVLEREFMHKQHGHSPQTDRQKDRHSLLRAIFHNESRTIIRARDFPCAHTH